MGVFTNGKLLLKDWPERNFSLQYTISIQFQAKGLENLERYQVGEIFLI